MTQILTIMKIEKGDSKDSLMDKLAFSFSFLIFLTSAYFWERDRVRAGEGQREKETQNPKRAPGSEQAFSAEPDVGLTFTDGEVMTWAEVGHLTDRAPQAPHLLCV